MHGGQMKSRRQWRVRIKDIRGHYKVRNVSGKITAGRKVKYRE